MSYFSIQHIKCFLGPPKLATSQCCFQSLYPQNNPLHPLQTAFMPPTPQDQLSLPQAITTMLLLQLLLIFRGCNSQIPWDLRRYLLKVWCCSYLNYTGSSWLKEKTHRYLWPCCIFLKYHAYNRPKHKQDMTMCSTPRKKLNSIKYRNTNG